MIWPNAVMSCALANCPPGRKARVEWHVLRSELEAWLRQPEPVGDGEKEK